MQSMFVADYSIKNSQATFFCMPSWYSTTTTKWLFTGWPSVTFKLYKEPLDNVSDWIPEKQEGGGTVPLEGREKKNAQSREALS